MLTVELVDGLKNSEMLTVGSVGGLKNSEMLTVAYAGTYGCVGLKHLNTF